MSDIIDAGELTPDDRELLSFNWIAVHEYIDQLLVSLREHRSGHEACVTPWCAEQGFHEALSGTIAGGLGAQRARMLIHAALYRILDLEAKD